MNKNIWHCEHCKEEFNYTTTSEKANHSRWCDKNPKRNDTENLKKAIQKNVDKKLGEFKDYTVKCSGLGCNAEFIIQEREKQFPMKEKYFCSSTCAHRRGLGEEWSKMRRKDPSILEKYTTICFTYHVKQCAICDEKNIVEVHHLDENHNNNDPINLIPLCPNHHQYWHSSFKHLIEEKILNYIEKWKTLPPNPNLWWENNKEKLEKRRKKPIPNEPYRSQESKEKQSDVAKKWWVITKEAANNGCIESQQKLENIRNSNKNYNNFNKSSG